MIKLLRKEEEFQGNTRKFLYWVNPGQVSRGTRSRFNFVLVAPAVGVYLFSHLSNYAEAETKNWKGVGR